MKMVCPFCHRRIDGDSTYCMFCGERVSGSLQQLANSEPRATPELPPVPPKPRNADRYKELVMIGKGGMGEVWSARDSRLNRKVAIKRILAKYMKSSTVLHRFLREARSIAQLSHYNIVQIYELEQDETGIYIVMEFVDGQSVLEHLRAKGPYSVAEIVPILSQICDALSLAHDRGIIHRDIKPANILLTTGGVPKLVDFGLAHEPESDSTAVGSVLGTVDFMAPEQRVSATNVDGRADVFGLAATAYQMLTGERPRHLYPERIPIELRQTLLMALEEHPDRRIPSTAEFKRRLTVLDSASDSSTEKVACPRCGKSNPPTFHFCGTCGQTLVTRVMQSGKANLMEEFNLAEGSGSGAA
ncbi:MAG TPA: protein kinase [Fibrobacteria bacterium]|nr:protein kinase [Fibrobacteria bacterium]